MAIYVASTKDANTLKENSHPLSQDTGYDGMGAKPTYGVLVRGVRTNEEGIGPSKQAESIEKI